MFEFRAARGATVACLVALAASRGFAANGVDPSELGYSQDGGAGALSAVLSEDTAYAARWVVDNADSHGRPFAVVDKRAARLSVFDASGRVIGVSPVLLGLAPGDGAVAGIEKRAPASLAPFERTTPAGRFDSQPGHNDKGEDIVWIDYASSLAIHRLRPAPSSQRRVERLGSPVAADKRISFGCVVVPVAFYEQFVLNGLGRARGVVYVLPETRPVQEMLGEFELSRTSVTAVEARSAAGQAVRGSTSQGL